MTGKRRALRVSCALLAGLALATGCSDTCTCPDGADETGYPDQSTPETLFEKLEMAYEEMDVDAYMECLSADFIFYLNPADLEADPTLPEYWDKADERLFHRHMFAGDGPIESVSLTVTVVSADSLPGEDPDDRSDDLWEYETIFDLHAESGLPYFATGRVVFVMRQASDREETTWQIVEQHDLIEVSEWLQHMTLTGLKLAFGGVAADSLYPIRSSPENVLLKLELAYERMDAEAYLDCLAEEFLFYLNIDDLTDVPWLPEYWDKDTETAIHTLMFSETTDIEWITLEMTTLWSEYDHGSDPEEPSDDRWTYVQDPDLRVGLPPDLVLHVAGYHHEFVLGVDPDDVGDAGALLWEIVAWFDKNTWEARSETRSGTTWGSIKALFWVDHPS